MEQSVSSRRRIAGILLVLLLVIGAGWLLCMRYLSLEDAKRIAAEISGFAGAHPFLVALAIFAAQAVGMTFSLPTKGVLTVMAGALLGPIPGALATLSGVLLGTTALFFGSGKLFGDRSSERADGLVAKLTDRIRRRPILAVAGLRLVITLPYGPITIAASLAGIDYKRFLLGSIIGDLPVVLLYSFAGERLAAMATTSEAVSPLTLIILAAAGIALFVSALAGAGKKS